ncbi:MAG TPA: hypothetical protein VIZ65_15365 [Cellvibrionaceae bacterium]
MKKISTMFFLLLSWAANAEEASNLTITNFGVQGAAGGYFRLAQPLVPSCLYDVVYFAHNNHLSTLLAAKLAGKKLSRLTYSKEANGTCNASLIEIE